MDALLTDLYELAMIEAYLAEGLDGLAVFELFVRRLPRSRAFLLLAGLEQALAFIEGFSISPEELAWLEKSEHLSRETIDYLAGYRFTGDVDAMPEGTPFFADEPVLTVSAPLPMAQLLETRLMNLLHAQTTVASKAARCVLAAPGKTLVEFGLRRAHGAEAGLLGARAAYLAGFDGSSNLLAEARFGVPAHGTMAHAFIQAHASEAEAFRLFRQIHPDAVLLLDTYDTLRAAREVVALSRERRVKIRGVRLDSGDLADLSKRVRAILDDGGLTGTKIFASGGLDETDIARLEAAGAPIDGYGVGTRLAVSSDSPALDCVYKLVEYDGRPVFKSSPGKRTRPGRKQVYRAYDADGRPKADLVLSAGAPRPEGEPLLRPVLRGGRRVARLPTLEQARERARRQLSALPAYLRRLGPGRDYPVRHGPDPRA